MAFRPVPTSGTSSEGVTLGQLLVGLDLLQHDLWAYPSQLLLIRHEGIGGFSLIHSIASGCFLQNYRSRGFRSACPEHLPTIDPQSLSRAGPLATKLIGSRGDVGAKLGGRTSRTLEAFDNNLNCWFRVALPMNMNLT